MADEVQEHSPRKKLLTLCIIHQNDRVLLGMKKRGFGAGRWNGFGGKVELNETIDNATKREVHEEAGIQVDSLEKFGILEFSFTNNPDIFQVHIFRTSTFSGEPTESDEMKPQWFNVKEIPFKEMWPDDIYWLPLFLEGKKFKGKFVFGESTDILEQQLTEVQDI